MSQMKRNSSTSLLHVEEANLKCGGNFSWVLLQPSQQPAHRSGHRASMHLCIFLVKMLILHHIYIVSSFIVSSLFPGPLTLIPWRVHRLTTRLQLPAVCAVTLKLLGILIVCIYWRVMHAGNHVSLPSLVTSGSTGWRVLVRAKPWCVYDVPNSTPPNVK